MAQATVPLPQAPVHEFNALASSVGPSDGCITSAASRLGVDIMQLPIRLATTYDNAAAMANLDDGKFIGSCPYYLNMGYSQLCSHPNLQMKKCGFHNCQVCVHHLCQVEWEADKGFEETTIIVFTLYCLLSFQPFVCFATVINPHLQWTKSSTCHTGLHLPLPSRISYLMMKHCLEA
jgi:hypothetical protein